MELFKLIFDNDLRLDDLLNPPLSQAGGGMHDTDGTTSDLAAFMKPDPTYSRIYLSGTQLAVEHFGLSVLSNAEKLLEAAAAIFTMGGRSLHSAYGIHDSITEAMRRLNHGQAVVIPAMGHHVDSEVILRLGVHSGTEPSVHRKLLGTLLEQGHIVLFKEKAHHGFDLQFYAVKNYWRDLFQTYQELVLADGTCRFFSINAKRMRSERLFYFETWSLDNPPHGFEEVFRESVL